MKYIKVLVVDDHPIVREGIKLILELVEGIQIVDEATNGKEALNLIKGKKYDIILLDIQMPIMNGLEFLQEKERLKNDTSVIILTIADDKETILKAMSLGVKNFLLKDATRNQMIETVLATAKGVTIVSPEIEKILISEKMDNKEIIQAYESELTEKEMFVLYKIVKGITSKEIAIDMKITERTVKAHLTNIYRKLEVNSRSEAVATAIIRKIIVM